MSCDGDDDDDCEIEEEEEEEEELVEVDGGMKSKSIHSSLSPFPAVLLSMFEQCFKRVACLSSTFLSSNKRYRATVNARVE